MATDGKAGVSIGESWRDLARRVQEEENPEKMIALVEELIARFDEEKRRTILPLPRRSSPRAEP